MHVLREVHKALRPKGILLDMHPVPQDVQIEVVHDRETQAVGTVGDPKDSRDVRRARRRLSALQAQGLFNLESRAFFDMSIYNDSVDAWLEYRRERGETGILTKELLRNARRAMRKKGAQLVVRERIRASSLRRI